MTVTSIDRNDPVSGSRRALPGDRTDALTDQLVGRLTGSATRAQITSEVGVALVELRGSVATESLPEMAIQLAEHRLTTPGAASGSPKVGRHGPARWTSAMIALVAALLACTACAASSPVNTTGTAVDQYSPAYLLHRLTPFAKQVLKDKKVDLRELLEATQHREQCLTAHGVDWSQSLGADGYLGPASVGFDVAIPTTAVSAQAVASVQQQAGMGCFAEDSIIEDVWILQHPVTDQQIADAKKGFASCLREAGLNVPADASFDVANKDFQSYTAKNLDKASDDPALTAALDCAVIPQSAAGVVAPSGLKQALSSLDTTNW